MKPELPQHQDPLRVPVQFLKGIGPARASVLASHGVQTVGDVLYYFPRRYLDKTTVVTIADLQHLVHENRTMERAGVTQLYTVVGQVRSFRVIGFRAKARLVLVLGDATGSVQCVWFGGVQYWKRRFSVGDLLAVSGRTSWYGNVLQFVHPDVERLSVWDDRAGSRDSGTDWVSVFGSGGFVPVYPSSKQLERVGLDSAGFRRVIGPALKEYLPSFAEVLPDSLRKSRGLEPIAAALRHAHFPLSRKELDAGLFRLKYEEFFFFQVMLALQRHRVREEAKGIAFSIRSKLARQLVDSLPFQLTRAQVRVINEITADMQTSKPLNRLLQGDVGSGKTIVALIAMLIAVENGYQACFMAPTEILAEQHHRTLTAFLRGIPVNVRLLVGGQRTRLRRDILQDVQRGSAQIVVGTHALLEQSVQFARLGLVVIDEQHRFGVVQRAALRRKGEFPDVVVMTATPIPRTLSMTLYGELDLSIIDELPKNRKPIQTVVKGENEKEWVFEFTREQVSAGRQAYYVYPLIEESEKVDLKAATKHAEYLQNDVFPELRLGLLHGRMPSAEKDSIMERFKNGEIDILVTTTVIEVGIDIPNATLMVIENAERFGLSQLHQLRGRVGRGSEQSYCILFSGFRATSHGKADSQLSLEATEEEAEAAMAKRRLATMAATNDGFKIAEVDLELRGPGDFLGTRQSGLPEFKVANLITDASILVQARKDAFDLVQRDPGLKHPEHYKLAEHVALLYRDATLFLRTA